MSHAPEAVGHPNPWLWAPTSASPVPSSSQVPLVPETREARCSLSAFVAAVPSHLERYPQTQAQPVSPSPTTLLSEALLPGVPSAGLPSCAPGTTSRLVTHLLVPRSLRPPRHRSAHPMQRPQCPAGEVSAQTGSGGARGEPGLAALGQPGHPNAAPRPCVPQTAAGRGESLGTGM